MEFRILDISDSVDSSGHMITGHLLQLRSVCNKYYIGSIAPQKFGEPVISRGQTIIAENFTFKTSSKLLEITQYTMKCNA